jgi:ATP/maltotriose-dependent transcriptional regulator MalT
VIADAAGIGRMGFARLLLAGFRGDDEAMSTLVRATELMATTRGDGGLFTVGEYARSLLYNGLGRYDAALPLAERASARDGVIYSLFARPELVEAATRSGQTELAAVALERLTERTRAAGTDWALGIEARSRALLASDRDADALYLEAVDRLGRCRVMPDLARAHLLYGEWLRRAGRRVDARKPLRTAHGTFTEIGMRAFAERARTELSATGEHVRRLPEEARDDLTAQERQIAELARAGLSNPEIGSRLFLSPRTVEWHLHKVFGKLGVRSRHELAKVLPSSDRESIPT